MDRYVDAVAMLIGDLDHLLVTVALGHPNQATELADTMIHMHHIVAYLELLDLLQRECHLTTAGLVALEVVFMETVEDLMIGEETDAEIIVSKSFVKSLIDRRKDNILSHFGKDILQTLVLFLAVGEDIDLIALQQIILKGLGEQVEILMEERLHRDMELQSRKIRC